jgi:type IV secretory pathway TrbF-like protein
MTMPQTSHARSTPDTAWLPPPDKASETRKRQFVELYGELSVTNFYLKVALLFVSAACLGLVVLEARTLATFRDFKPLIVRIDAVGRAEALRPGDFAYEPQEREIKYFLSDFVERHYSRIRSTVRDNYARSLFFLDGRVADALIEANKKAGSAGSIESFLTGLDPEVEVTVKNVVIEDLRKAPYRATVDFEKAYLSVDRSVSKRETFVANFVFVVKNDVPNAMIPVNPLGLAITYFRADQAFR